MEIRIASPAVLLTLPFVVRVDVASLQRLFHIVVVQHVLRLLVPVSRTTTKRLLVE